MKISKTKRMFCWILIYAFTLMQGSPAWANEAVTTANSGNTETVDPTSGNSTTDPIDTKSGCNYFTETDLAFNASGVPVLFARKYNSTKTYESPFGTGWVVALDGLAASSSP